MTAVKYAPVATKHPAQHRWHSNLDEESSTNSSRMWYPQLGQKLQVNNFSMQSK